MTTGVPTYCCLFSAIPSAPYSFFFHRLISDYQFTDYTCLVLSSGTDLHYISSTCWSSSYWRASVMDAVQCASHLLRHPCQTPTRNELQGQSTLSSKCWVSFLHLLPVCHSQVSSLLCRSKIWSDAMSLPRYLAGTFLSAQIYRWWFSVCVCLKRLLFKLHFGCTYLLNIELLADSCFPFSTVC